MEQSENPPIPASDALPDAAKPPDSTSIAKPPQPDGSWRHGVSFWFGTVIGTVVGIIGATATLYGLHISNPKPLLTFGVNPLKSELQRPDYDKDLGFVYKGKPVNSESVTSVQVSVWNAGTKSIRAPDILESVRMMMPDHSMILSVRVKKASRPICEFKTIDNQEDYRSGVCRLSWRILESDDGAVLQIIYAGSAAVDPRLEGVVEGQKDGIVVEKYSLTTDKKAIVGNVSPTSFVLIVIFLVGAVVFFFLLTRSKNEPSLYGFVGRPSVSCAGMCVCILAALMVAHYSDSNLGPPFGW